MITSVAKLIQLVTFAPESKSTGWRCDSGHNVFHVLGKKDVVGTVCAKSVGSRSSSTIQQCLRHLLVPPFRPTVCEWTVSRITLMIRLQYGGAIKAFHTGLDQGRGPFRPQYLVK